MIKVGGRGKVINRAYPDIVFRTVGRFGILSPLDQTLMGRFSQKFYLSSTTVELKGFEPFFLQGSNSFKGSSYSSIQLLLLFCGFILLVVIIAVFVWLRR